MTARLHAASHRALAPLALVGEAPSVLISAVMKPNPAFAPLA
jgi:hypothetical protein